LLAQQKLADRLNEEGHDPEDAEVGEHPEGAKRGGHVPVYNDDDLDGEPVRAFYDDGSGEWVQYDG
jgi:hypothetical protein